MAEKLIGPQPIIGPGGGPIAETTEYAPLDEAARRAIYGLNPKTGKAFTEEESAAINGGYNPYAGAVGYQIDPRNGSLNILKSDGTVLSSGAKYQKSSAGFIVPQKDSLPAGVASDEYGKYYQPGQVMPGESLQAYVQRMAQIGPGQLNYGGKTYLYNASGMFYQAGADEPANFFAETNSNPKVTSSLQAGEAVGKFTKLPSGLWQIGDGGETTSGIGFARLLARKGFDATRLPVGATLQVRPTGEVVYQGKTYLNTDPKVIKSIEDKVNKAAQAGVLAGATGQGLGRIVGGFSSSNPQDYVGMKISDVFAPESWPPGYKWDSPIPPEGIPQSRSSHVLPITKEVLGPYYESYAKEYGPGGSIQSGIGNIPQENMPYYGDGSTQNMPYYGAGATRPFITSSGATLTGEEYNKRVNAMSSLTALFERYGLGSLAPTIKNLAMEGAGDDTITLRLMESQEYQDRFSANKDRLKKGLSALTPGEYLRLEDGYRQVLRAYGLKAFDNDAYVKQFISNDVSPDELSNRVVTAVQRVQNADPAVMTTLRDYYGIGNNDLVAYVLDPNQQFQKIERQVAAAEIGTAARLQGIEAGSAVSEQLAAQGITKAQAQKGYSTIADILPTAEKLSDIYGKTLEQYRLPEAEQEVFNSLASAQRKRRALTEREIAAFGGSSGLGKTSLDQANRSNF